ncbi:DEAD/DEAH box helicase [Uliginosibacterium sp. TH139]|uniref:DEAD/DEAH box helicase n=1 Tax=Uliginosibacterium sp. TH139 TaxID=2067453 RepID=UPI000C7C187E|nr:DEAD/DEAH box helicase [Uliginosibacterium sp. TH139]PLK48315.1 DEAD/DEAH box helicase [Uliginosibacterium sp. TH139]
MMTNSPASSSDSQGFQLLDERIQRWIWGEGWTTLRDAQEKAIPALIDADRDVIVAAATAAGKTEAAFFPILTHMLRQEHDIGTVLYIGPLKALINDQWSRLSELCESLDIPVVAWHGDVAASKKQRFIKDPSGILLITPESLEALFVRRGSAMPGLMSRLRYIVIDELHAFIGSERGKQLQSLLHRLERTVGRKLPLVGLSATLGDMGLAASFLRPDGASAVELIVAKSGGQELKVLIKGYVEKPPRAEGEPDLNDPTMEDLVQGSTLEVAQHLYAALRGSNNLVFPNSRRQVEIYADLLRRNCERNNAPNEFWAHHGSLSKEFREETERALKDGVRAATAICTTTLELGIDIGTVKSVCQIGSPPSVASLRQRLGRSGRRKGEPAILRGYCIEPELGPKSGLSDCLREGLVQSVAMVRLLINGWFEPPRVGGLHLSTLVQQLLSIVAEQGGATASELWACLVKDGAFSSCSRDDFVSLLRHLGDKLLVSQDSSGLLLHGELGEKLVNHYDFYAAFASDDEFRIVCEGRTLGSLPVSHPLLPNQRIIFGGRRWRVIDVNSEQKVIVVAPDKGGAPPAFDGGTGMVHDIVRQEMRQVLSETNPVPFLDATASTLLTEARHYYRRADLDSNWLIKNGNEAILLTWRGDWVNDGLAILLASAGLNATNEGVALAVSGVSTDRVIDALTDIAERPHLDPQSVLADAKNLVREKWDWALPETLLRKSFASLHLDLTGAQLLARKLVAQS